MRTKGGVRLSFTNSTTAGNQAREQTQQYIQQTFEQIGVEMIIRNFPAAVLFGDYWRQSQFDSHMTGTPFLVASDPDTSVFMHSNYIPAKGGQNVNLYSNPEVDKLLEEGRTTFGREDRKKVYDRLQEHVREDLPFLPLFQRVFIYGIPQNLNGFEPNVNITTESWNVKAWSWV